jgi:hypothetical protein
MPSSSNQHNWDRTGPNAPTTAYFYLTYCGPTNYLDSTINLVSSHIQKSVIARRTDNDYSGVFCSYINPELSRTGKIKA